ncbi:hypothetical protein JOF37_001411 [Microbacterium imperiale]|nr:hypothetical protein [Microbacterium imperiale]
MPRHAASGNHNSTHFRQIRTHRPAGGGHLGTKARAPILLHTFDYS